MNRIAVAGLLVLSVFGCATLPRTMTDESLAAQVEIRERELEAEVEHAVDQICRRLKWKITQDALGDHHEVTLDVLILSGGGEYGAFGAGFLRGWGRVGSGPLARPDFDVVTGISTGALIAPFALIGHDDSYAEVQRVYERARPDFAVLRSLLFFLPWQPAFYDNSKLQEYVRREIDADIVAGLRGAFDKHKLLFIGTTDLDLGRFRVWEVAREFAKDPANAEERLENVLLASTAIPAAFPPVIIDGRLHVDGGASEQLFIVNNPRLLPTFVARARAEVLGDRPLRIRTWIIVNNTLRLEPEVVPQRWTAVAERSIYTLLKASMASALQRAEAASDLLDNSGTGVHVEFRYVAIPEDVDIPRTDVMFDPEVMRTLSEFGYRLGAQPECWRTRAPHYPKDMDRVAFPNGE